MTLWNADEWRFDENPEDHETYDAAGVGRWGSASAKRLNTERNEMTNEAKPQTEGKLHVPPFRVSFPQVFQPKAVVAGQEAKYSISMLFPKTVTAEYCALFGVSLDEWTRQMNALKAAVTQVAIAKWGPREKWPKGICSPWHAGTEKDYDGYDDKVFYASASSKIKPGLVDSKMNPIIEPNEFGGGDYARATVTVFAYDNMKKGVSFGLRNIQKLRDGERFGGASKPEDDFGAIDTPQETATAGAGASELGI